MGTRFDFKHYIKDGEMHTVCCTVWRGHKIRGVAICDRHDTYNEEKGNALAKARCEYRLAEKRSKMARKEYENCLLMMAIMSKKLKNIENYVIDSQTKLDQAIGTVRLIENKLHNTEGG